MLKHIIIILALLSYINTLPNGLAITPPMGWNSWNRFGCNITEDLIRKTADELVSSGLVSKGYVYLNLDDCWQFSRTTKREESNKTKQLFLQE